jgi:hypothetical protein
MLSESSRVVLDALLPSRAHPELSRGLFDAGFEGFHEDFRKTALPSMRLGFKTALLAATWLAPLLIGRLPPLSRLDREDRERALEAMGKSCLYPIRQLFLLLKAVSSFCYGADPEVRRALGYPSR